MTTSLHSALNYDIIERNFWRIARFILRLEFPHTQNNAGMLGAYYHFILNENQRAK